jgi:SOS-response transcriptional repressor LexA
MGVIAARLFENEFIRQGILSGNELPGPLASISMEIAETINEAMGLLALKQAAFAKKVGVAQGTISKWLQGDHAPNTAQWDKVKRFLVRNPKTRHLVAPDAGTVQFVPLVSWVSAGGLADAGTQIPTDEAPRLALADLGTGEFFALRVEGDSMDRISPDGSVIIVNRADRELKAGNCYVFALRGDTTFKIWQPEPARLEPHSTNPVHKTVFIRKNRDFEVVGRVKRTMLDL